MCMCKDGCEKCKFAPKKWQKSWEEEAAEEVARQRLEVENYRKVMSERVVYYVDFQSKKLLRRVAA